MIRKIKGKFYVYSEDGKRRLSKGYETKSEAAARLRQIEYFKNKKGKRKKSNNMGRGKER